VQQAQPEHRVAVWLAGLPLRQAQPAGERRKVQAALQMAAPQALSQVLRAYLVREWVEQVVPWVQPRRHLGRQAQQPLAAPAREPDSRILRATVVLASPRQCRPRQAPQPAGSQALTRLAAQWASAARPWRQLPWRLFLLRVLPQRQLQRQPLPGNVCELFRPRPDRRNWSVSFSRSHLLQGGNREWPWP
jgi:hypothetical protein